MYRLSGQRILVVEDEQGQAQVISFLFKQQFGAAASLLEPGMLIGTPQEVIDRIGAYVVGGRAAQLA